jgi:hypothetical protein
MNPEEKIISQKPSIIVVMKSSEPDSTLKNSDWVAVLLLVELLQLTLENDGFGDGDIVRAGYWGLACLMAPVRAEHLESARVVVERLVGKFAPGMARVAAYSHDEAGSFDLLTIDEAREFGEIVGKATEIQTDALHANHATIDLILERISKMEAEVREQRDGGEDWKNGGEAQ